MKHLANLVGKGSTRLKKMPILAKKRKEKEMIMARKLSQSIMKEQDQQKNKNCNQPKVYLVLYLSFVYKFQGCTDSEISQSIIRYYRIAKCSILPNTEPDSSGFCQIIQGTSLLVHDSFSKSCLIIILCLIGCPVRCVSRHPLLGVYLVKDPRGGGSSTGVEFLSFSSTVI